MLREERRHRADGAKRSVAVVTGRAEPRPAADQGDSRELGQLLDLRFSVFGFRFMFFLRFYGLRFTVHGSRFTDYGLRFAVKYKKYFTYLDFCFVFPHARQVLCDRQGCVWLGSVCLFAEAGFSRRTYACTTLSDLFSP